MKIVQRVWTNFRLDEEETTKPRSGHTNNPWSVKAGCGIQIEAI